MVYVYQTACLLAIFAIQVTILCPTLNCVYVEKARIVVALLATANQSSAKMDAGTFPLHHVTGNIPPSRDLSKNPLRERRRTGPSATLAAT